MKLDVNGALLYLAAGQKYGSVYVEEMWATK